MFRRGRERYGQPATTVVIHEVVRKSLWRPKCSILTHIESSPSQPRYISYTYDVRCSLYDLWLYYSAIMANLRSSHGIVWCLLCIFRISYYGPMPTMLTVPFRRFHWTQNILFYVMRRYQSEKSPPTICCPLQEHRAKSLCTIAKSIVRVARRIRHVW